LGYLKRIKEGGKKTMPFWPKQKRNFMSDFYQKDIPGLIYGSTERKKI